MTGYEPTVWVDNAAEPRLNADALNKIEQGIAAAGSQDSPTFTGNVTLPSTTTIGTVSPTELGYLDGVTSGIQSQLNAKAPLASPALTGTPTTPTAAAGTNTTQIASTAYVRTEVANIVNSAPATLDTLNEIAQALGSDPNFATTMTNLINTKAPSASPTFTGTVVLPSTTSIGTITSTELGYLDGVTSSIQTQLGTKAPSADPTFTGTVTLPTTTSIGNVSSTELGYLDGVTSAIQTQLNAKVDEVASTDNAIVRFDGAGGAVQNSSATLADDGSITATYFNATSNAAGTNYKVGDDAWIGDVNWANTIRITGVTEPANGYLIFGNGDSTALGRAGTGALTYGGNTIWHAGNDGSSSGLDADLLDGNHASAFALNSHTHTIANITSLQTTLDAKVDEVASTDNAIVRFDGAGGAVQNSSATLADDGSITATYFNATSNAAGTNYKVGDDAWIGDVNWANTIRITGVTEPANGYLIFGNGDSTALGRAGTGALTYGGNTIWHAGNDGSSSGLDADLLDGNHASAFALNSHTHTIANITSLQTTLDAKAPLASPSFTGTVTMPNVSITSGSSVFYNTVIARDNQINVNGEPTSSLGSPSLFEVGVFPSTMTNKLWFYDTTKFTFEYTNNGTDWITQSNSTTDIKKLVGGAGSYSSGIVIPNGAQKYRITIRNDGSYVYLNHLYAYWSTNGHQSAVEIWKKRDDGSWTQHTNSATNVSAWPAHLHVPFNAIPWSTALTSGHYNDVRIVFTPTWSGSFPSNNISLLNIELWSGYPAGKRTIYDWDYDKNVTFPNNVSISGALTLNGKPAGRVHVQSTAPSSPADGDLWVDTSTPTWTAPTFQNSWVNYGSEWNSAGYYKDANGVVHLRGLVKSGSIGAIFTLPAGYRPTATWLFICASNSSATPPGYARVDINTSGSVSLNTYSANSNNGWVSLDGITFATF